MIAGIRPWPLWLTHFDLIDFDLFLYLSVAPLHGSMGD